jgi:DUF4097 and DUF4098 domain-containing protein YvlB
MKRTPWLCAVAFAASLAAWAQTPIDQTKPAKPDGRVSIDNVSGSITVMGWDQASVQVKGTLGANTEPLVFEVSDGTTRIAVKPKRSSRNSGDGVLTIRVPKQSRVEVDTVSAEIHAKDLAGAVDLHTVSGEVTASGITGDISLESVSGKVQAEAGSRTLRCSSVSGNVQITGKSPLRVEMESVSGDLGYDGGLGKGGELKAETVSGPIEIRFPASVSAEFDVSTFSGSISSDLPAPLNLKKDGPVGKNASFRTGGGDGRVRVETFSGSVRFVKK